MRRVVYMGIIQKWSLSFPRCTLGIIFRTWGGQVLMNLVCLVSAGSKHITIYRDQL